MNPWEDGALPALPATRRHLVGQIHQRLELRLAPPSDHLSAVILGVTKFAVAVTESQAPFDELG